MHQNIGKTLGELRKGMVLEEATAKLKELVQAVNQTAKPGTLTIAITVSPNGNTESTVFVTDKITLKLPTPKESATLFYIGDDHSLTRQDPAQLELSELREVK